MFANFMAWIDKRLPVTEAWNKHLAQYPAPKNFNFWYFFGSLAILVLVNQILTGVWLTMSYEPSGDGAFASVEYIMRRKFKNLGQMKLEFYKISILLRSHIYMISSLS